MRISDWSSDVCSSDLQSLAKGGVNLFTGDEYGGLSQMALWYIGGVFKHARAINAFTNSGTNSYKRLVPGFEAPVMLAYSARNRSASCRIPYVTNPKARRIEMRFPDPIQSGYLTFTRSEEHTSELQSLMRISYAVFCLKKKTHNTYNTHN